ncbi:MAG: type II toxin-antitoxin system RelE/ParE family toxin [Bacteroidetes bacterium]|nr:MAG: type II toxin-antitoxin system RelE/ParE family toxin [Bacteroidota bacterium]
MKRKFEVLFMEEAERFIENLPPKPREKLLYNLKKAQLMNDARLFKKIHANIWEFRTISHKKQYRLFAFWDNESRAMVICTHGIIKKTCNYSAPSG